MWIASFVGALLLLLLFWYFLRPQSAKDDGRPVTTLAMPSATENASPHPTAAPAPVAPATTAPKTVGRKQWRVVAYTYNHEDQAKKKVSSIAGRTPALNPEIFSPTGHAPYLVTLGGPMSREDAVAFRRKAISAGLPEDTYIQNYSR
jgi:hypothetical protein